MVHEDVETIVDKYIRDWDMPVYVMKDQILNHWEMDQSEKDKALKYLRVKYNG